MKNLPAFLIVGALFAAGSAMAKEVKSIQVLGNCGMCESRIEKAALEAGASRADWDENSKMLTVTFKKRKTSLEVIQRKIAAVGHDNGSYKATDDVYNKLPGCCKYDRSGKPGGEHK